MLFRHKALADPSDTALCGQIRRAVWRMSGIKLIVILSELYFYNSESKDLILISQFGVGLIKSVDDACRCKLIFDVIARMLLPIVKAIEGWRPSDCVVVNPG